MRAERIASIATHGVSFDVETHLTQPGIKAPPLVCGSAAIQTTTGDIDGKLLSKEDAIRFFTAIIERNEFVLIGANIAYDLLVMAVEAAKRGIDLMPQIFAAYKDDRIFDVQIAEALHGIALGMLEKDPRTGSPLKDLETGKQCRYNLGVVVDLVLGRRNAKVNDFWRERYALLENVPLEQWPLEARTYPVDDSTNTLEVGLAQCGHRARVVPHDWNGDMLCNRCGAKFERDVSMHCHAVAANHNLHNLSAQAYAAWAMHLGAACGFNVDIDATEGLAKRTRAIRERDLKQFIQAGFFKIDKKTGLPEISEKTGSEKKIESVLKKLVAIAYGAHLSCPRCVGSGKVPGTTKCKSCDGVGGACCGGGGRVDNPKTQRGCPDCDATGFVLEGCSVPRTESGEVAIGRDPLSESGDELLMNFAAFSEADKILTTYVPFLRKGIDEQGRRIPLTLWPNVLLANGRASYSDVVQLMPREGGVRECIVPRPGYVFCSSDYGGLELVTHAQSCLWIVGYSKLAEALNAGVKVHDALAATIVGVDYERFLKEKKGNPFFPKVRQASKPANFGFPGGMSDLKLVHQQRKQGPDTEHENGSTILSNGHRGYKGLRFCVLLGAERCGEVKVTSWGREGYERTCAPTCRRCIEVAKSIKNVWLRQWPENDEYFDIIGKTVDKVGYIVQHKSKRIRGGVDFCSAANGYFSALAAEGAKLALCRVAEEQYVIKSSPLYGSRTILFAHDELFVEMREESAHEASIRLRQIMVESMREYTPDVAVDAEPTLMRRWWKAAEPVYRDGRLVPSRPEFGENGKPTGRCIEDVDGLIPYLQSAA